MLHFVLLAAVVVLALGPRAVLTRFNTILFSPVQQCGSFTVHFAGGKPPAALPLTLTVIPFDSVPISIAIPNADWNDTTATGAMVTFLPFPAETEFVASLDDALGVGTGLVSNIIRVSPSNNNSCLPSQQSVSQTRYTLSNTTLFSQCEPFDVSYDPTVVDAPPLVRAFVPRNITFNVNSTLLNAPGNASYTLNAAADQEVVFMFSDDTGFRQTTGLFPVAGNSSSSTACLPNFTAAVATSSQVANTSMGGLSRAAVIAIGVASGTVVGGVALIMAAWLYRERHRSERASTRRLEEAKGGSEPFTGQGKGKHFSIDSEASPMRERRQSKPLPPITEVPVAGPSRRRVDDNVSQNVKNLPYADPRLGAVSPISPKFNEAAPPSIYVVNREPLSSIPFPIISPLPSMSILEAGPKRPVTRQALTDVSPVPGAKSRSRPTSISSDDIEHMLEMATMYSPAINVEEPEGMATPSAASLYSNVRMSTFGLLKGAPTSPLPRSPNPSNVRNSDGAFITDAYASSNWVSRSPNAEAGSSALLTPSQWGDQGLLTPTTAATYRDPPQAHLPSSPLQSPSNQSVFSPSITGRGILTVDADSDVIGLSEETMEAVRMPPLSLTRPPPTRLAAGRRPPTPQPWPV